MGLDRETVARRVKTEIADLLGASVAEVTEDKDFCTDLNADSLDQIELLMNLEEEFGIEITDEAVETAFEDGKYPVSRIIDEVMKLV